MSAAKHNDVEHVRKLIQHRLAGQGVYIKVEYEKKGIDVKLLNVLNTKGQRAFDIGWVQAKNTKIRCELWAASRIWSY
jgi:hypothetical protein